MMNTANTEATMANTNPNGYAYDTEPCTRCGGYGQYSYCQMYGSTCFKCGGSGLQLTRAAKRAKAKVADYREGIMVRVPATELKAGQWVLLGTPGNYRRVHLQADARVDPVGRWTSTKDGVTRSGHYVVLEGQKMTHHVFDEPVPLALTPDQVAQVREFALKLKGVHASS